VLPRPISGCGGTPCAAGFSNLRREFSQPLFTLWHRPLVLVVHCANSANLLLERAMARQKEIAGSALALGAGPVPADPPAPHARAVLLSTLGVDTGLLSLSGPQGLLRLVVFHFGGARLRPIRSCWPYVRKSRPSTGLLVGLAPALLATPTSELSPTLEGSARKRGGERLSGDVAVAAGQLRSRPFAVSLLLVNRAGLFVRICCKTFSTRPRICPRQSSCWLNVDPVAAGLRGAVSRPFHASWPSGCRPSPA